MAKPTFFPEPAQLNHEERKKNLEGYFFIDAVLRLTESRNEAKAYEVIKDWKRIAQGAVEVSAAMEFYGKRPQYKFWKRKVARGIVCHLCGRVYHSKDAVKYFYNHDPTKACKKCIEELKPEYGRQVKRREGGKQRASERRKEKLKAQARREAMVRAYTAELRDQGLPIARPGGGVGGPGGADPGGGGADCGSVPSDGGGEAVSCGGDLHDESGQ